MANLYELTEDFLQVQNMIENGEELQDTLESINLAMEDKLENIGKLRANLKASVVAFKDEENRLAEKRRAIENKINGLQRYAENALMATGKRKIEAGTFTFGIQKNPTSLDVVSAEKVPKKFFIEQKPEIDKAAIKRALKDGEEVPGVKLKQTEGLRIR